MITDPRVKFFLLPGGTMPKRQTDGAVGYDVHLRAIVSPFDMDTENPKLRRVLFDFKDLSTDPKVSHHVIKTEKGLVYRMDPHESVLVGIGFVTQMPRSMFYWVAPRSGLAAKWGITVTNAPGTVDSDYRGEAGVLVYNRNDKSFDLEHNMRIAQIIFQEAIDVEITQVSAFTDLEESGRGAGGFGSTGL